MSSGKPDIDKEFLYGRFQEQEDENAKLHTKAKYKALDMKQDDDVIEANKTTTVTNTGMSTAGVLGAVGLAALLPSLLAGYMILKPPAPQLIPPPTAIPAAAAPAQPVQQPTEWEIEIFRQKDGRWEAKQK